MDCLTERSCMRPYTHEDNDPATESWIKEGIEKSKKREEWAVKIIMYSNFDMPIAATIETCDNHEEAKKIATKLIRTGEYPYVFIQKSTYEKIEVFRAFPD